MKNTEYKFENGKMITIVTDKSEPTRADFLRAHLNIRLACVSGNFDREIESTIIDCECGYSVPEAVNNNFSGPALDRLMQIPARRINRSYYRRSL